MSDGYESMIDRLIDEDPIELGKMLRAEIANVKRLALLIDKILTYSSFTHEQQNAYLKEAGIVRPASRAEQTLPRDTSLYPNGLLH